MKDKLKFAGSIISEAGFTAASSIPDGFAMVHGESLEVPEDYAKRVEEVGDTDPMYVTVSLVEGVSRYMGPDAHPNRWWKGEVVQEIADQVNAGRPVSYMGHVKQDIDLMELPENIPVNWVKAARATTADGRRAVLLKGHVKPSQVKMRESLKLGSVDSVSVNGFAEERLIKLADMPQESRLLLSAEIGRYSGETVLREVTAFKVISIDFVRKDLEGLPRSDVISLTSETQEVSNCTMTPEEIKAFLESLTVEKLQAYNPTLVSEIAKQSGGSNESQLVKELVEKNSAHIRENVDLKYKATHLDKVCETLKCTPDQLHSVVAELKSLADMAKEATIKSIVESQSKKPEAFKKLLERKLTGMTISEMTSKRDSILAETNNELFTLVKELGLGAVSGDDDPKSGLGIAGSDAARLMGGDG